MPKVIYSMGVSLDGFIAGPDGRFEWAAPDEELHRFHNEQTRELAVQLCGRGLYETMVFWETAEERDLGSDFMREFAEIWRRLPKIVFSTTLTSVEGNARLATRERHRGGAGASSSGGWRHRGRRRRARRRTGPGWPDRRIPSAHQSRRGRRRNPLLPCARGTDRPRAGRTEDVRIARCLPAICPAVVKIQTRRVRCC